MGTTQVIIVLQRIKNHPQTSIVLIWSCLFCLPFGRLVELPVLIMGISAVALIVRGVINPFAGRYRFFSLAFMSVMVPVSLSVPDAVELDKAAKILLHIRFYLAGVFVIWALDTEKKATRVLQYSAWLLFFWILDALLQFVIGQDLFGNEYIPTRLNGIFGEDLKLGLIIAVTTPILLVWFKPYFRGVFFLALVCAPVFTVIAGGSRASWVILGLGLMMLLAAEIKKNKKLLFPAAGGVLVLFLLIPSIAYFSSSQIAGRIDQTLLLFSGDYEKIDQALTHRLPIWEVAVKMVKANPVNGVGARNFRHAYSEFAKPDDYFLTVVKTTPAHPHQLVLEFAVGTGLIGVFGLILLFYLLMLAWSKSTVENRILALPIAACLFASLFPVNTHMALFSSFWGQFIWWLVAIYIALLSIQSRHCDEGR